MRLIEYIKSGDTLLFSNEVFRLQSIDETHLPLLYQWRRDPAVSRYLASPAPASLTDQQNWFRNYSAKSDQLVFIAFRCRDDCAIGYCQFFKVGLLEDAAEFGVVIGDPKLIGSGVGYKLGVTVLALGLGLLSLNRIYGSCHPDNSGSNRHFTHFLRSRLVVGDHPYRHDDQVLYEVTQDDLSAFHDRANPRWRELLSVEAVCS